MYIVTRFIISSSFPKLDERNFGQGIADPLTLQNTSDPTMEIDFKMVVLCYCLTKSNGNFLEGNQQTNAKMEEV